MLQLVGYCTVCKASLHHGLDAVPDSGTNTDCRRMVCYGSLFQSDYELVVLHISRNGQTGTTDRVVQDAIDKVCYACNERTYPVRVGTLTYGPLQNVWLLDAFQKTLECSCVRSSRYLPQQLKELW